MRERIAAGLALVICAGVLVTARPRGAGGPEAVVAATLEAARRGDTTAYLACFRGDMRGQLEAACREAGPAGFAATLRAKAEAMAGMAVTRVEGGGGGPREAVLRVELVYRDRNEVQEFRLRRAWARWQIEAVGPAVTVKMPVAYGTPVGSE